jgi:hypothetical protein
MLVRQLFDRGVDAVKVKHGLPVEELVAAIAEAESLGLPSYGHTWTGPPLQTFAPSAISAGLDGASHMLTILAMSLPMENRQSAPPSADMDKGIWASRRWLYIDEAKLDAAIDELTRHNVWLEPTLISDRFFVRPHPLPDDLAYLGKVPGLRQLAHDWLPIDTARDRDERIREEQLAESYARTCDVVGKFYARGGTIVAGTDDLRPGPGLHHELELLIECGVSPLDALKAATSDAAIALQRGSQIGTVEAGKLADMVILEADPLASPGNLRRIWRVVKGGVMHDPDTILNPVKADYRARVRRAWARRVTLAAQPALIGLCVWAVWRRFRR